ncbi:MAG: Asp-tRNA(Asn)/Glu-tRNA(Gln) amidotransferase subunit GatC [Candidatus Niyogibacteria bacterium]|nr:Asp-tRNA(Asn)/Glu-tRNA(Gln) amidotransferase subunit GatC [Candidatus Niyogibacteria bacterium]
MITREDVKKMADLARIELDASEGAALAGDLERILDYIEKLKEVNTKGVEGAATTALVNEFRLDAARSFENSAALLDAAPHTEHGLVSVKKIIEK